MTEYKIVQKGNKFCIKTTVKSFWGGYVEKYVGLDDDCGTFLTLNAKDGYWTDEQECRDLIIGWTKSEQERLIFENSIEKEIKL